MPQIFLKNREVSWLSFNERVLQEAQDEHVPIVERIKFLGIVSSNQDEFFRIRVSALHRIVKYGQKASSVHTNAVELLDDIHTIVLKQQHKFEHIYSDIIHQLAERQIFIINETELNEAQSDFVKVYFRQKVLPALVPVMIDKIGQFPYLRDKSIYLAIRLLKRGKTKHKHALVEVPADRLSRFLSLPAIDDKKYVILLDDVIRHCVDDIFYIFNYDNADMWTIKLTRDAELDIDNDIAGSIIEKMSHSLKKRKKGMPVRLVYDSRMPDEFLKYFISRMHLDTNDLIPGGRYHNFKDFTKFPNIAGSAYSYAPIVPIPHSQLKLNESLINIIRQKDCILHLPYQSFDYFIGFLRESSIDPKVKSVKITLYRVAENSNVINALINAARNGKSVTVVLELHARFDEEANIDWAKRMEDEGIKLVYGVPGLKVHTKMCLVTRVEKGEEVHYANLGTGNYHEITAQLYCDHSFFTARKHITEEVHRLFEYLEFHKKPRPFKHLIAAPFNMRKKMLSLIGHEIKNAKAGKPAYIIIKVNHIVDDQIIGRLYEASRAGVKIQLIARTTCSLIPGIPKISENIEAISIVDRFLEHARAYIFCNNDKPRYYLSSADMMMRNLDHRVEVLFPIYDVELQQEIRDIIEIQLSDNVKARVINEAQSNQYKNAGEEGKPIRSQVEIYNYLKQKNP